jgi:membrane-bound lytic murein transglycosylase D
MPTELALLPFVESAFNPQAVSIAKAAGIWQFMPATGRHFDLKQNVFRDDRRDVMASTRAALDYLQRLYGMFGDWHLALASYNWGEGSVGRAVARNQRAGLGTRYQDLRMPDETRYYVPRLQALKNVVASPGSFNVELPLIPNHPYFQDVDIKRDIDVALAARLADVKLEDFRALNPSANRPIILAAGTGKILLPWDNAEVFKRNLQAHSEGRLASWTAWSVPSTMSVAEAARRSGMTESELRSVNNIPPRMLIKAGSWLRSRSATRWTPTLWPSGTRSALAPVSGRAKLWCSICRQGRRPARLRAKASRNKPRKNPPPKRKIPRNLPPRRAIRSVEAKAKAPLWHRSQQAQAR